MANFWLEQCRVEGHGYSKEGINSRWGGRGSGGG
jgi:hypothetical protein